MKLVTIAEMRALEAAAIAAGTSDRQMIEEAGLAVAQEVWLLLGTIEDRKILVLAGPGNNGADGIVAARNLLGWGAVVAVYVPRKGHDSTLLDELQGLQIDVILGEDDPDGGQLADYLEHAEVVVDALLGIGQARPLNPDEPIAAALQTLARARKASGALQLLAVDVPTGLNGDTGLVDPLTVPADVTITFGMPKVGMYQGTARSVLGRLEVVDIGIPKASLDQVQLTLLDRRWAKEGFPLRPSDANKGTFGRVLVVGGSSNYLGAPALSATAAYRTGAGLVSIACPEPMVHALAGSLPEATWLPQAESDSGGLRGETAIALRREWSAFSAAVIGPGMGLDNDTSAAVWAMLPDLARLPNGVVLDADALNAIAPMDDAPARLPPKAVLTPHPGELARLLGRSVREIQSDRLESAREAAERFGCTVVLKGAYTVVAHPDGRRALSPFANPLLATAGSGDVLAGAIAGYLAQGVEPFVAASLGVFVHGAAGDALSQEYGTGGVLASELAARLPRIAKELQA